MIAALLAAPMVEGIVGQVVNCFSPSSPATPPTSAPSFNPYLNKAITTPEPSPAASPIGTMRAEQWNQMGNGDVKSWVSSLAGRHVDATETSGRTISGVVNGVQQVGNALALNIGGHLVSLSQLQLISWSPAIA